MGGGRRYIAKKYKFQLDKSKCLNDILHRMGSIVDDVYFKTTKLILNVITAKNAKYVTET